MTPAIIASAGHLLARYDIVLCDIWGVVHDGVTAYADACDALARFRKAGGTVILVSNAPVPAPAIAALLDDKGVPRAAWDAIVSSGDLALQRIAEQGYGSVHAIGPPTRDAAFFSGLKIPNVPIANADAIACTGLIDDRRETANDYRPQLETAFARRLPFVCANPDLVVDVGAERWLCAGSIATIYEAMGGDVFWAGKPHPVAYDTALRQAAEIRDGKTSLARVLAIGDAVRTDLAAAKNAGVDALFIASGLHRHELMPADAIDPAALATLLPPGATTATAAIDFLRW